MDASDYFVGGSVIDDKSLENIVAGKGPGSDVYQEGAGKSVRQRGEGREVTLADVPPYRGI